MKVLGTFAPEERSSMGTKVPSVDFLLLGMKVQRNEKSVIPFSSFWKWLVLPRALKEVVALAFPFMPTKNG